MAFGFSMLKNHPMCKFLKQLAFDSILQLLLDDMCK